MRQRKNKKKVRERARKETLLDGVVCQGGLEEEERETQRGRGTEREKERERENPNQKSEEQNNKAA